jgi:hypothetical protein
MSTIPLSVSSDYLPNWGAYEGLRELVQNFIDSQDDCGIKGDISYEGGSYFGTVTLTNNGAKALNRDALLFGVTSKAGRDDQRGQFGEGMKVGTLALVRESRAVTIKTQTENWVASLSPSKEFGGRKVLTFETNKRKIITDNVSVIIHPVYKEEWDKIQQSFMFMQEDVRKHAGYSGSILLDESHKGKVFAKGIFVKDMENMKFGYDLSMLTLNRDRSMVDEWDVRNQIIYTIVENLTKGTLTTEDIYQMFADNNWEAQSGYQWRYQASIGKEMASFLAHKHGCEKCVITSSVEDATRVESFGWNAIRVPKALAEMLEPILTNDTYNDFRKSLGLTTVSGLNQIMQDAIECTYELDSLTEVETDNLTWAQNILASVNITVNPAIVKYVRDGELLGLYKGGKISISRHLLANKHETLSVLVHEYSHNYGPDASLDHTAAIESIWQKIAKKFLA